ncbi:MAG: sensor histidine kinase [Spirulina sp.]
MLTSVAPPLSQVVHREDLNRWKVGWEACGSVCQLQVLRLVQQGLAAAGWIIYDGGEGQSGSPRGRVVAAAGATAAVPHALSLTSETALQRFAHQAREVQPGVGGFYHRLSSPQGGWVYGLRFPLSSGSSEAYLLLWRPGEAGLENHNGSMVDASPLEREGLDLALEVAALQTAIRLDQDHRRQRQRVDRYQNILRCLEHQLRHPLAMIHLYAANLQNSLTQDRDRQQAQTIREAVGHLNDHLTDLIAGCQRSQMQAEVCSIPDLWAEAWQGLRLVAQEKAVNLVLADRPLTLWGDQSQLVQAFTNLLHNALCFSPPQGQISAQWQVYHQEVVITLADQGPGLSPTDLQHLFRPYYSNRPQGSGIGLTVARQIVQQHGGKLWAENLPQGGAQFSMVLPLAPS